MSVVPTRVPLKLVVSFMDKGDIADPNLDLPDGQHFENSCIARRTNAGDGTGR